MMIRTFVSVPVPMTDEIAGILTELRGIKGIRASPAGQVHLTMKFLGDTDEKKVLRLCQSLKVAMSGKDGFDVVIEGIGAFPNERDPKVIWLGIKDPENLKDIAGIVDTCVKDLNIKADDKPFSPHMTIGRVNYKADLKGVFNNNRNKVFCSFRCDHINVMKSVLTPKGAIHSIIESIPLG